MVLPYHSFISWDLGPITIQSWGVMAALGFLAAIFIAVKEALAESFDRLDELQKQKGSLRGVATGFIDLDDTLAGLQPSNLIILAARPALGKTSLALNIAQHVAVEEKLPVGFFSLEMSKEELVDRFNISSEDLKNLSIAGAVSKMMKQADGEDKTMLGKLLDTVNKAGVADLPAKIIETRK